MAAIPLLAAPDIMRCERAMGNRPANAPASHRAIAVNAQGLMFELRRIAESNIGEDEIEPEERQSLFIAECEAAADAHERNGIRDLGS